jgi:hypothetical protein
MSANSTVACSKPIRDHPFVPFQPHRYRFGQDVQQQPLASLVLALALADRSTGAGGTT